MSQGNTPATLPPTFRVRPATPDDAEALIAHVHRLCEEPDICIAIAAGEFDMTVEQERQFLADMAASDNSTFLVAEADGQVVGSLHCTGGKRRSVRHVTTLGISVRREWRGRGVGSALLAAAVDWAKGTGVVTRIELAVFARNDGAVRLYERFGFVTEGRRRRAVLRNGRYEDDLVMGLLL